MAGMALSAAAFPRSLKGPGRPCSWSVKAPAQAFSRTRWFSNAQPAVTTSLLPLAAGMLASQVLRRRSFSCRTRRLAGLSGAVLAEYPGRANPDETRSFALSLAEHLREGKSWSWDQARLLVEDALQILEKERTLEHLQVPVGGHVNVVGDVHGQFFDLLAIFEHNGLPSAENPFVFNGDFVDRGSFSVEVLLLLLAWKVACPSSMRLSRGNHEAPDMNLPYGFTGEVLTKYGLEAYNLFQAVFNRLPLAHVINSDVLVCHGGLPREPGVGLSEIESLDRVACSSEEERNKVFTDLLWADPRDKTRQSERGGDIVTFGPDVTQRFLKKNGLSLLIRSHEVKDEGYEWQHDRQCLTVFSAPLYCDSCDNLGAVIRLHAESEDSVRPEVRTFKAAEKPEWYVPAMVYSPMNPAAARWLSHDAKVCLSQMIRSS